MKTDIRVPARVIAASKAQAARSVAKKTAKETNVDKKVTNVKQGVRIALVTPTYLRTALKKGIIAGKKLPNGEWEIEVASLREYAKKAATKRQKLVESLKNGTYGQNIRPTTATANRMRKFVEKDQILTGDEKRAFFAAINRYEKEKDAEYAARTAKAEGK